VGLSRPRSDIVASKSGFFATLEECVMVKWTG
jgi:hypothetical protein